MQEDTELDPLCFTFALLGVCIAVFLITTYFEMQSFNHVTGLKASYWDAIWLNLSGMERY